MNFIICRIWSQKISRKWQNL